MKLRRSHGTGSYLARYTTRPHEDIERGWTAGINVKEPTRAKAVFRWIVDRYGPREAMELEDEWKSDAPEDMEDVEEDEAFVDVVAERYHIITRQLPGGQWVIYDHEGLTGYRVVSQDGSEPTNDRAAMEIARVNARRYKTDYHSGEDGDATVGRVRYVASLGDNLHVFWAESIVPEPEARERGRGR